MRVVLDTNVIVSAYLTPLGTPAQILAAWRAGRFELVVSEALLAEYEEVLSRPRLRDRHGLAVHEVARLMAGFRFLALLVQPEVVPAVVAEDPDDDHVLAAAVAGAADVIVTGDPHLARLRAHRGIRILAPAAFLALLEQDER